MLPPQVALEADKVTRDSTDLELSESQLEVFAGWRRPREIFGGTADCIDEKDLDDILMLATTEIDLVQDVTADCSVVASLCASTARTLKGHGKVRILSLLQ